MYHEVFKLFTGEARDDIYFNHVAIEKAIRFSWNIWEFRYRLKSYFRLLTMI